MSIKVNTVGYIKYMYEKGTIKESDCSVVKFRLSSDKENFKKYDKENNEKVGSDTITCVAFGNVADYIYDCYSKLKSKDFNKVVRVDLGGFLEIDEIPYQGSKMRFISKNEDTGEFLKNDSGKEELFVLDIDSDLYFKTFVPRIIVREASFIDLESTVLSKLGKKNVRSASIKKILDKGDSNEKDNKDEVKDTDFDDDFNDANFSDIYKTATN